MKVHIGPYKRWFGPYQLAQTLCFWAKHKDEFGLDDYPRWVHSFGEWLAHGSVEPEPSVGEVLSFSRERKNTLLYKFLLWIDRKKKRKIKVHIDRWDAWDMSETLAYIILPMLRKMKNAKQGSPWVADEDVPEQLRKNSAPAVQDWEIDDNYFKRWDYVLDEMIFAFENKLDADRDSKFTTGEVDMVSVKQENGFYELKNGPKHTAVTDVEAQAAYEKRIANGFRLFGKYYESLWT
jgi:hypothetical protein